MTLDEFSEKLCEKNENGELEEFTRQCLLHGTPHVFSGRDADYYQFKQKISSHLQIHHTEIFLVGSGKLGFSPHKGTNFSLDSDIDIAIVAPGLWEKIYLLGMDVEHARRLFHISFHSKQADNYQKYLQYMAIGWVRPDLMPYALEMRTFKDDWFEFFKGLSHDGSEVGNYKVTAGVFRAHDHLERYSFSSMRQIRKSLLLKKEMIQ